MGASAPNVSLDGAKSPRSSNFNAELEAAAALRLELNCDLAAVREIVAVARAFLAEHGLLECELMGCELALVEACNNAILYAPRERDLPIGIQVLCDAAALELQVIDHTDGFDLPATVELPGTEEEHGRGLFIIRSLMDEVHYLRSSRENRLIMRKQRAKPEVTSQNSADHSQLLSTSGNAGLATTEQVIGAMSKELCFRSEELSAIFRCASQFGNASSLDDFSQRLLEDLQQIAGADWFVLRLLSTDSSQLFPANSSNPKLKLERIALPPNIREREFNPSTTPARTAPGRNGSLASRFGNVIRSVERRAALSQADIEFDQQRPLSSQDPMAVAVGDGNGLVHPILMRNSLLGTLAIGRKNGRDPFTKNQIEAIRIFSDFLAIQIVNTRLRHEQIESRLLGHELDIARKIQQSLLPKTFPSLPGFGLAGFCLSARQVGGDFYDVLPISKDRALLVVADVMGKGVPAAMFAATLRTLIHTTAEWTCRPAEMLSRINRLMFDELSGVDMFITATIALLEPGERRLLLANAGHCQMLLADKTGRTRTISPEGMPLGIVPALHFEEEIVSLENFRCALLYTDGIIESRNTHGDFFGEERLREWVAQNAAQNGNAAQLSNDFLARLNSFQGSVSPSDDQTFLILSDESEMAPREQNGRADLFAIKLQAACANRS